MDPLDITKAYQKHIGQYPIRDIPFLSLLAGAGSYALAPSLLKMMARTSSIGGSKDVKKAVSDYVGSEAMGKSRLRLALLAAAAAGLYGGHKHLDWLHGLGAIKESLLNKDYWKENPEKAEAYKSTKQRKEEQLYKPFMERELEAISMDKDSAYNHPYYEERIDKRKAMNLVRNDPVLFRPNRRKVIGLINDSSPYERTSGFNITNTALRAGVDFLSAYLFGRGMGKVLAVPDPIANRLSKMGGVATAVIGSGILKEI